MTDIWIISDTHFNHHNIIKYCDRPFKSSQEMDEVLIQNWNSVVKPNDIVYHLGDVYFGGNFTPRERLQGRKRLILGNHDNGKDQRLQSLFQKIMIWRMWPEFGILLTHVPVHESTLRDKCPLNVHGHIHQNSSPTKNHRNVCVEMTDYTPINIEALRVK